MRKYFILLLLTFQAGVFAQPQCQFTHYSTEDGLPQYTIMDILQDKKGFMWFATWDGLSKFDGFRFTNYKAGPESGYTTKSNRVQKLWNDAYNRIWFNTYDGDIHCFSPDKEIYWGPQLIDEYKNRKFPYTGLDILPAGDVWLKSLTQGCVLISDSVFSYEILDVENKKLKSNTVYKVFQDQQKFTWILTGNGLVRKNGTELKYYFYSIEASNKNPELSFFTAAETRNDLFFGAENGKVWQYSKTDGRFTLMKTPFRTDIIKIIALNENGMMIISRNEGFMISKPGSEADRIVTPLNNPAMKTADIENTFTDNSGNVWFDTRSESGIYKYNYLTGSLKNYKIKTNDASALILPPFSFVFEDVEGRIWVQPKGGGFSMLNKVTEAVEPFYNDPQSPTKRFSNIIHSAFSDKQGNLWMCTRSHGLEKIVFSKKLFSNIPVNPQSTEENNNDVRAVFEDKNKILWVATKDKRITLFDQQKKRIGRLNSLGQLVPDAFFDGMVYAIHQDTEGNMWLGTKGEGLVKLTPQKGKLTFKAEKFMHNPNDINSISNNNIYSIFQDSKKKIWIGTYGGGLNLAGINKEGKTIFYHYRNGLKNYPGGEAFRVRYINQDKKGNICLGTTGGLVMFSDRFSDPSHIRFSLFTRQPEKHNSLSNNDIHGICISSTGVMYLATFGGGINKVTKTDPQGYPVEFKSYTSKNGLPSDITLAIMEDEQGKLWISTESNLSRFNPENGSFESYNEIKGIMSLNSFSEASSIRLSGNEIIFGNSKGLLSFIPGQIINSNYKPYLALTDFQLFNQDVPIGEKSPLTGHIDNLKVLKLKYNQNFFTIEYAALDFINPENIVFAYKMEGFDNDWNYVQKQRKANYTNLPHGTYTFRLKSTNSEGVWIDNERQLKIIVKPSFWETIWAYLLYIILTAGIIYIIIRTLLTFYHLKQNIALEKKMSELKLRFFTDISHEIRTPLTMITAPLDMLMQDHKTPEQVKNQLRSVYHNTNRLLRLVNQILDFRKIQFIHLKVNETEFSPLIQDICENFIDIAKTKQINFSINDQSEHVKVWVDAECVDKIVMNLLSNAFKFTPEKKSIVVNITHDEKYVSVQVVDEGPGITGEKQRNLFTRFATFNTDKSKPGTGIGLSMVKDLADKHGAKITVDSMAGKGTSFTVSFLKGTAHFDKQVEIIAATGQEEATGTAIISQETSMLHDEKSVDEKPGISSILIVEDDPELRNFIKTMLETEYSILLAENGREGLAMAISEIPDFIVSDIMMPEMDGVEMLQQLKTNLNTSHIPVVLLTAKTTIESKLEGLAYGADDYITKPFSVSYFKARIANLIAQRKHLQELFMQQHQLQTSGKLTGSNFEPQPFTVTSQDEALIRLVMKNIEDNMDNFEYTIDDMRDNAGMSRSAFFKKIKSLTGLAPVEFVRDIKMKRAAQLLASGEYRVKEVTYMVGFSDSKYFAKCFREKYGVTPMEYKQGKV